MVKLVAGIGDVISCFQKIGRCSFVGSVGQVGGFIHDSLEGSFEVQRSTSYQQLTPLRRIPHVFFTPSLMFFGRPKDKPFLPLQIATRNVITIIHSELDERFFVSLCSSLSVCCHCKVLIQMYLHRKGCFLHPFISWHLPVVHVFRTIVVFHL